MNDQPTNATRDRFFAGALNLLQPGSGHRAGTDAVLLAASLPPQARDIADLGAASGIVGLRAAQINSAARVTLFERETALIRLAVANIVENGLAGRVEAVAADAFGLGGRPEFREAFDCLLTNPPFYDGGRVRPSPNRGRAAAHVFGEGEDEPANLDGWLRVAAALLAPKGRIVLIHAAAALPQVLAAASPRFGALRLRFVHPQADQPAIRLLLSGRKGSRAPPAVLPPLVLHQAGGSFTPEADALHRGEARLDWDG